MEIIAPNLTDDFWASFLKKCSQLPTTFEVSKQFLSTTSIDLPSDIAHIFLLPDSRSQREFELKEIAKRNEQTEHFAHLIRV